MQYNVLGNLGSLTKNTGTGAKAIARIVNYNQPDIITFNELAQNAGTAGAMVDWVTNNLTYFGNKTGVTFWVDIATNGDGSSINGSISRYPISNARTYSDAGSSYANLRGMESFKVQLSGTNALQVFHVHLKASSTGTSCPRKQEEAAVDATNMVRWASTNAFPYVFTGDCNESEDTNDTPECTITSTYHPITTLVQGGKLVNFEPTTLGGDWITWSTGDPAPYTNIRFDHVLHSTNRISTSFSATTPSIVSGYVFSTTNWAANGLYTNASSQNLVNDSQTASDHYCVQVNYWFPTSVTNFDVTPTNAFASSGNVGGPFSPSSQVYALTNSDTIPLFWSVTKTSNWLTVSPLATNMDIGARVATNVTASINSTANSLSAGTYVDTIIFSNTATGVILSRNVTLTVGGSSPPTASFTGNPTNGLAPLAVTFSDASTGDITNRLWGFGDGNTSNTTATTMNHTYSAGTNTVSLTVSGSGGSNTLTRSNYIVATNPAPPVAGFSGSPTNGAAPLAVTFTDSSTGSITNHYWNFGDGATSNTTATTMNHTYSAGTYPVSLTVSGSGGANTLTRNNYITAINPPVAKFMASPTSGTEPLAVTFTDTSTGTSPLSLSWNLGDNFATNTAGGASFMHSYAAGTYTVTLTASNSAGTSTLVSNNLIAAVTPYQAWQLQFFGCTNCPQAAPDADPFGKGMSNTNQFLAGLNPTNPASVFRITSVVTDNSNNTLVTWSTAGVRTNAVQATAGDASGGYSTNNFQDISSATVIINVSGDTTTNYTDVGAATNTPSRYYRVRLVP